jgi:tetratricopeptide (TPR) repeat protein
MSDVNQENTVPVEVESPALTTKRKKLLPWILLGIALILLFGGTGAFLGYQSGIQDRQSYRATQVYQSADEQYQLALADIKEMRFDTARQRLEAVIQMDPAYPGAVDQLTRVILALNVTDTPTPTLTPTVTLTPTPDLRGVEEMFNQIKQFLVEENWQGAIDAIENLRREKKEYRAIEVDGLYYLALRNRGIRKVAEGSLEMGLYDLSLAERFGYLDTQAEGIRTWARLYLTGASFWEVDWAQSAYYFKEILPYYPGMRDVTGVTAKERYRFSTLKWADQIAATGDMCRAHEIYAEVMALGLDGAVQPTLDFAFQECNESQATEPPPPAPTSEMTATPTPPPAETPVGEATPTPGENPTEIPVPTDSPEVQPTPSA